VGHFEVAIGVQYSTTPVFHSSPTPPLPSPPGIAVVWIVEKKIVHHMLGLDFERVTIPVRVSFEFEVSEGSFLPDSLSSNILYNRSILQKRYPRLNLTALEDSINNTVQREIRTYLRENGFLEGGGDPHVKHDAH
jgi:hypothetical protein